MHNRDQSLILTILLLLFFICVPHNFGQEEEKIIRRSRVEVPPKIDGRIDDGCWESIQPISGFFQFDPVNGVKASEETQVWAAYDQKYIYFAFLMKDSHPEKIWAELTPRNA